MLWRKIVHLRHPPARTLQPYAPQFLQPGGYAIVLAYRRRWRQTLGQVVFTSARVPIYAIKRLWVRDVIVVYPERLRPYAEIWLLAMLSGYRIV